MEVTRLGLIRTPGTLCFYTPFFTPRFLIPRQVVTETPRFGFSITRLESHQSPDLDLRSGHRNHEAADPRSLGHQYPEEAGLRPSGQGHQNHELASRFPVTRRSTFRLAAIVAAFLVPSAVTAETILGRVVAVYDGDTVTVLEGSRRVRVRLAGIDAPERPGQPYSEASRRSLAELVAGKQIRIEASSRDHYGRPLGRLYVQTTDVNLEQVRRGYAWSFDRYNRDPRIALEAAKARLLRRGLWVDPNPTPPWVWRRQQR